LKTKLIFIDGPDDSGKTTFIQTLKKTLPPALGHRLVELKFNKGLGGLLRINRDDQFEILKALLPHLCRENIYIVDRCYLSNIVYDKVLRNEDSTSSLEFRDWCQENLTSIEIVLDRPYIEEDFADDLLSIDKKQFNEIIDEYRKFDAIDIINNPELYSLAHNKVEDLINE
jgi:thymidylate kinase